MQPIRVICLMRCYIWQRNVLCIEDSVYSVVCIENLSSQFSNGSIIVFFSDL